MQIRNSSLYRLARRSIGASLILVTPALVTAADFPSTLDDYVTVYEINSYRQFQNDSAEYRRRLDYGKELLRDMEKHGGRSAEAAAKDWFVTAAYSGASLPARPAFEYLRDTKATMIAGADADTQSPADESTVASTSAATQEPQAEYDWQDVTSSSGATENEDFDGDNMAAAVSPIEPIAEATDNSVAERLKNSFRSLAGESVTKSEDVVATDDVATTPQAIDLDPPADTMPSKEPAGAIASTKKVALDLAALVFGGNGNSTASDDQADAPETMTDSVADPLAEATPEDADSDAQAKTKADAMAGVDWPSQLIGETPQAVSGDSLVSRVNAMIDDFNVSAEELEREWDAALEGDGSQIEGIAARLESALDSRRKLQSEIAAVSLNSTEDAAGLRPVMDFGALMQDVRNSMAEFNATLFETPQAISFEDGVKILGHIQDMTSEAVGFPNEG